ncbi:MAG: hypothetical protein EOO13_14605 [Chitinophagaceae bacterium]|nr:MAG: hypothetical protein EOO13_14605 [Chitinophagaceae bacterium]
METNQTEKYVPINCDFYDELEALATIGKRVNVIYQEGGSQVETAGVVRDLYAHDGIEYMKLDTGVIFRLDKLVQIDGKIPPNVC